MIGIMWKNPVRQRLENGEIVVGLTLTTTSIEAAAHAACLGFHLLWVEMEHSPITLETLRLIVLATRGLPAAVVARVPINEIWTAKRVLDQGVTGVAFPWVSTAALARQAVEACQYPPAGRRGSGAGLAMATWMDQENYYDSADRNVLVIAVIEDLDGLNNIEAIAATPRIDVIFVGTGDLSFALGLRGDSDSPKMEESVEKIAAAARRHGKFLGRPAGSAAQITAWRKQGFQFFQTKTELGLMTTGAEQLLSPLGINPSPRNRSALY
jgi:2-keto-3-deoxy-L-rhamnonate aldolase RhmA